MDLWKVKAFTTTMTVPPIILERGLRDKNTARGPTTVKKKFIKEHGTMDKDMVRAIILISWPTKLSKDNLWMARDKVKEN